jgi:Fe-S-cluster containining protein
MPQKIHYQCQRCTACCRWPGLVPVDAVEIAAISAHLGLSEHDFIQRYTRLRPKRDGLALIDQGFAADGAYDHACIFLDGRECTIQPVKPRQCAGFPNTWNFSGWREQCEAIPALVPAEP